MANVLKTQFRFFQNKLNHRTYFHQLFFLLLTMIITICEKKKTLKINGIFLLIITNKENVEFIKSSKTAKMINCSEIELIENT